MLDLFRAELNGVDDSGPLQTVGMLGWAGEQLSDVYRVQPFGLTSTPPNGAHGIGVALRGQRTLAALLGGEDPASRLLNGVPGTSTLYDMWGNKIALTQAVKTIQHSTKIVLKVGTMVVSVTAGRIDLGADPAPYAVVTTNGPSTKVFSV